MRFVAAKDLSPGMIVGKTFYSNSMSVMLRKGIALSDTHIRAIHRINIGGIYIDDELTNDIPITPLIDDELKFQFAGEVKNIFTSVKSKITPNSNNMEDIIKMIVEQISSRSHHVVNMFDLKSFDDYTFQHSIDVCILSVVVGIHKNLPFNQLYNLALAGVYHDIGKMFIDPRILNKKGPLTAEEFKLIKDHPALGADYIQKMNITRNDILQGVLQHHERHDGTGYPNALTGSKISLFGKIIAISDVFDAITSERSYKNAMQPSEAIEYIMSNASQHFDFELAKLFINSVSAYPVGTTIRLSNGLTAIVAENFQGFTLRPRVKVLPEAPNMQPYYISLKDDPDAQCVTIINVIK